MTFTGMSPRYPYTVCTFSECSQEKFGAHASGARDSYNPDVGRIYHPADTSKISSTVAAPVAQKTNDFWFPIGHEFFLLKNSG
jgi:hypothetical protein